MRSAPTLLTHAFVRRIASSGAPALLDLRTERKRIIRGSQPAVLDEAANVRIGSERRKTAHLDRIVCVYHDAPSLLLVRLALEPEPPQDIAHQLAR